MQKGISGLFADMIGTMLFEHPIIFVCVIIFSVGSVMAMPFPHEIDFYDFHVWECEQCHEQNKSFAVCSGICYEDQSIDNGCMVTLNEICSESIEHGSITGQYEYRSQWSILLEKYKKWKEKQ